MSVATHIAAPPQPPGPSQDRPSDGLAPVPDRIVRLLVLVRWIIAYGTELAATLHQRAARPDFGDWTLRYRQSDVATIAIRIKRGLLLAAGLEAYLSNRVAQGRSLPSVPWTPRSPRTPGSNTQRKPARAGWRTNIIDLPLDRLPTEEQIAEELRRRPVGAVLVDICRDVGICEADLPPELRRVLRDAVTFEGGNLVTLVFKEHKQRMRDVMRDPTHPWHQSKPMSELTGFIVASLAIMMPP